MYNINEEFFKANTPEQAELIIIGAPFDSTTSFRPGARFGPDSIRNTLQALETYSPYQNKDMADYKIYDCGNAEIIHGNAEKTLLNIENELNPFFYSNKKAVLLGGEHLVTLGAFKSFTNTYPDSILIQFDAHLDMRENYLGEELSHACIIRRIGEIIGFNNVYQFAIRSGTKQEWALAKKETNLYPFNLDNFEQVINKIPVNIPAYVTIDLDVLDPSYLPGTGTPEPMGIDTNSLINAIMLLKKLNVKAADIVELAPDYDKSGLSSVSACFILRELILTML